MNEEKKIAGIYKRVSTLDQKRESFVNLKVMRFIKYMKMLE